MEGVKYVHQTVTMTLLHKYVYVHQVCNGILAKPTVSVSQNVGLARWLPMENVCVPVDHIESTEYVKNAHLTAPMFPHWATVTAMATM